MRFLTSPLICQLPPGTIRIPPPQLNAKRVPNLKPPVSALARKSEISPTPLVTSGTTPPQLFPPVRLRPSPASAVYSGRLTVPSSRAVPVLNGLITRRPDEMRRAAGAPLVVQARDRPALGSHVRRVPVSVEPAADDGQLLGMLQIHVRTSRRGISDLGAQRRGDGSYDCDQRDHVLHARSPLVLRSTPVISRGCSRPSSVNRVGPTSHSAPPERNGLSPSGSTGSTTTKGTGLVVCAVCGPPVSGSIIISQFP